MIMEQAREDMRKLTLCTASRSICHVVRSSRCVLEKSDVISLCELCAGICREYCKKASDKCYEAIGHLDEDNEEEYLKCCKVAQDICEEVNDNKQYNNILMKKPSVSDPRIT